MKQTNAHPIIITSKSFGENQQFEGDCACSSSVSMPEIKKESRLWEVSKEIHRINLTSSIDIISSLSQAGGVAILNCYTNRLLNYYTKPSSIHNNRWENGIRKLIELKFLVPFPRLKDLETITINLLTSWLHLTDRCNLRCDYCYLPHVREDMSPETGRAAIDATFRSAIANGFKQVKLKYAGGEPLLRFPLVVELHRYAQYLAEKHDLDLEGVVLSNGTLLTLEMIETIKLLDLRLMLSLDGLSVYHDVNRRYLGGRGSFADVAEAIDLALVYDLIPNISITVSSRTADGLPEVMMWILERELPFSLNFYRENDLSASHEDMRLDEQKIIDGMLAAFKVIENNLPRRPFLGGIIDRANLSVSHTHTCGAGQNYLVFDQNGQVAKCQIHIRKPITDARAADPLAVIRADQIGIQNLSVEEKEGCKTCEWKHWCAGGCPLETYQATGRYDVKSPNCKIYKALFPEALRLEGLRLLKYQDDPEVVQKISA